MLSASPRKSAFTLVELLVVIGIIALLISILLPSLNRARAQAASVKCLSNLRTLGQAMNLYSAEQKGYVVPGSIQWYDGGTAKGGRGEENWATILVSRNYLKMSGQLAYANGNTGAAADVEAFDNNNTSAGGDSVFRCPAGLDTISSVTATPLSKLDFNLNSGFWRRQSLTLDSIANIGTNAATKGAIIDTWYAGNFIQPSAANMIAEKGQDMFPMRSIARSRTDAPGKIFGGPLTKQSQLKRAGELAILYDGIRSHNWNTNTISLRHGKNNKANFLFADWHVEPIDAGQLPSGTTATNSDLRSVQTLSGHPFPVWRLDQR